MLDTPHVFSAAQSLSGTAAQNSTNVYNHGSAVKLFDGIMRDAAVEVDLTAVGGTTPTMRVQFVGADDAALTSNVVTLADTGVSPVLSTTAPPSGVAAAAGAARWRLRPEAQSVAKQYYGLIYTQSGTSPTATANAQMVNAGQTNLMQ